MKALILLGPAGSGKTTLAGKIFTSGLLNRNRTAYVFNDDGTPDTVDAGILKDFTDFRPMNSGCFGCRDEVEFLKLIASLESSDRYDWVIIEPLGFVEGEEVPHAVEKCGLKPHVITLMDAKHFLQNELLGVMPSQLRAANLGVGITKYPVDVESPFDPQLDKITAYIGRHAPGQELLLIPREGALQLGSLLAKEVKHSSHEHHRHTHRHDDDHGYRTYSFRLKKGLAFPAIWLQINNMPQSVVRVKGVVDGYQFHRVQQTWEQGVKDGGTPFITLYATGPVDLNKFLPLVEPEEIANLTTKQFLRLGMSSEKSAELIHFILDQLPKASIIGKDGPVTNPELHELLNEIRKRPEISPALNAEAIRARVHYYVMTAKVLTPDSEWWNGPNAAKKKRDLAIGIGWFCWNKSQDVGTELIAEARRINLLPYLADGLLGFEAQNSDLAIALEVAGEIRDTAMFIGKVDRELREGFRSCLDRAEHPELKAKWQKNMEALGIE